MTTVRQAKVADADEVIRLGARMYDAVGATVDEAWAALARTQIETLLGRELHGWVVDAETPGALAGCAFAIVNPRLPLPNARTSVRAYVQWVSVDAAYQRRGVATALMHAVEAWARESRIDQLELASSAHGRPLYDALGYVVSPNVDYPASLHGVPMRKQLDW